LHALLADSDNVGVSGRTSQPIFDIIAASDDIGASSVAHRDIEDSLMLRSATSTIAPIARSGWSDGTRRSADM
jgi:hypothetical protein